MPLCCRSASEPSSSRRHLLRRRWVWERLWELMSLLRGGDGVGAVALLCGEAMRLDPIKDAIENKAFSDQCTRDASQSLPSIGLALFGRRVFVPEAARISARRASVRARPGPLPMMTGACTPAAQTGAGGAAARPRRCEGRLRPSGSSGGREVDSACLPPGSVAPRAMPDEGGHGIRWPAGHRERRNTQPGARTLTSVGLLRSRRVWRTAGWGPRPAARRVRSAVRSRGQGRPPCTPLRAHP